MPIITKEDYLDAFEWNLANFQPIFMSLPMERKITRGRKKAAKPTLMRQSIDPVQAIPRLIEEALVGKLSNEV